jgi:hypothetical protein
MPTGGKQLLMRILIWGFWFGFALRRVALLCGVFVQLHLALFPAGGPFLPSLFVNTYNLEQETNHAKAQHYGIRRILHTDG